MPLKVGLRAFERIWINGVLIENGPRQTNLRILSGAVPVLRASAVVTKEQSTLSPGHELAYRWGLHHSGQHVLSEPELSVLAEASVNLYPALQTCVQKKTWFTFYNMLLHQLRA